MHSRVLREMADVVTKTLLMICEKSWQWGEPSSHQKKGNVAPICKKDRKDGPGSYWPVSVTSVLGKILEQILLEARLRLMKDSEVIIDNQYGSTMGKSYPTNLVTFSDGLTASESLMSSIWTSLRLLTQSLKTFFLPNWKDMDWMDGCIDLWTRN